MKQYFKTLMICMGVSALCFPIGYSLAQVSQVNGGPENSLINAPQVNVSAEFRHAAMVMFEHEPFVVVQDALLPGNDIIQNGVTLDLSPIQNARIEVYGINGELANLKCQIQQIRRSEVQTFVPVFSKECSSFAGQKSVILGSQPGKDISITNLGNGKQDLESVVSLEISYI